MEEGKKRKGIRKRKRDEERIDSKEGKKGRKGREKYQEKKRRRE